MHDLTHGRGRLGFLETKYHVVEKVREQVNKGGSARVLGLSGTAISVTKSIVSIVAATVTIIFLTFFLLLLLGLAALIYFFWAHRFVDHYFLEELGPLFTKRPLF